MIHKYLFVFFIFILFYNQSLAQCCSAGNPFFYGEQPNIDHKQLQVIAGYKYSLSDQYYHKDSKKDIDFIDQAYFNYFKSSAHLRTYQKI